MRLLLGLGIVAILTAACSEANPASGLSPAMEGYAMDMAACLREKGWNATAQADGSIVAEYPHERHGQYRAAYDECRIQLEPGK
jgi:hypothetical protein